MIRFHTWSKQVHLVVRYLLLTLLISVQGCINSFLYIILWLGMNLRYKESKETTKVHKGREGFFWVIRYKSSVQEKEMMKSHKTGVHGKINQ